MKNRPFGFLLMLLLIVVAAMGISRTSVVRAGLGIYPEILSLSAIPETAHAGEFVTLTWATRGADGVTLKWGPENGPRDRVQKLANLPATGSLKVQPTETTTYELACETISSGQMCMPTEVVVKVN